MSLKILWSTRLCRKNISSVLNNSALRCASTAPFKGSANGLDHQLGFYWDTVPPTADQLRQAQRFFSAAAPKLLFSTETFRTVIDSSVPEVAFLGRSNVGKSSLLNALMGHKICHTSKQPGRTRSMNFFAIGGEDSRGNAGKVVVLDMPGYGKGSRAEWGTEIVKYLVGRKQLRRAFLLVDALHGLKPSDIELLTLFRQNAVSHQVILSKVDRVLFQKHRPSLARMELNSPVLNRTLEMMRGKIQPGLGDGPEALGEILACSAEAKLETGPKLGINDVRWAVLAATGFNEARRKPLPSEMLTSIQSGGAETLSTWNPYSKAS